MIQVLVTRNPQSQIVDFEISGHAESGPYGYDLVCAAVSAVSFGAVNSVMELCAFEPIIEQGGEGGYLRVELPENLSPATFDKANVLLEGMMVSLKTIEHDYSEYIKISEL
ncbi:ribosomal-processing cysteine protease Prp [Pontibacillus yanchengensis]|uniref:Ribosomal-processing cysteine protease Prp n=2 Tax=Pontibacillus yanchengensis TaxID=462910 RepID=A0ACC7VFI1_9BACI|nr:ribosomal-processing cysteine protease Prp [Pontibacillus yanchengensis]MYL33322.1 ribosomal-processing cysteine protease Prp [Pontibacillus yanchengensis]MYL53370.1 ribosomal-processing cysteine protease Prp [Pontibacillus yanchengensis]